MDQAAVQRISTVVWAAAVIFVLAKYYYAVQYTLLPQHPERNYDELFSSGWIPTFESLDTSDSEWLFVKAAAKFYFAAVILQNVILRATSTGIHVEVRCLISMAFLTVTFGPLRAFFLIGVFGLTVLASRLPSNAFVYIVNLSLVYIVVYDRRFLQLLGNSHTASENTALLFDVAVSWSCLRAISLGLELSRGNVCEVISALCYYLYLPALCTGPLMNCREFVQQIGASPLPRTKKSAKLLWMSALKLLTWVLIMELMDHALFTTFVAFNYILLRSDITVSEYFGLTVAMMARFYVKYLIIYGAGVEAARLEGISLPIPPRCTLRITSGAHVWRTFDRGLYEWIIEYLYLPLGRKFFASVVCFIFACFWHGSSIPVVLWASINCALVIVERVLARNLHPALWVVAQIPLHWFAVFSNMFYLGDEAVAYDFFPRLFSSPFVVVAASVISLCACVVGRKFEANDRRMYAQSTPRSRSKNEKKSHATSLQKSN